MSEREREIAELRRRLAELERESTKPTPPIAGRAPKKNEISGLGAVAIGLFVLIVLGFIISNAASPSSPTTGAQPAANASSAASRPSTPAATEDTNPWTYRDVSDPMVDQKGKLACTTSTNMVQLDPPYQPVTADLCVRKAPKSGLNVYVRLNGDGQILCTSYEG
jgi:hypothetical protein